MNSNISIFNRSAKIYTKYQYEKGIAGKTNLPWKKCSMIYPYKFNLTFSDKKHRHLKALIKNRRSHFEKKKQHNLIIHLA